MTNRSARDGIKTTVIATAVMVALSAGAETLHAPRARFDAVCYTPAPGRLAEVLERQEEIAFLRQVAEKRAGRDWMRTGKRAKAKADAMHEAMCRDMMVVAWTDRAFNLVTTVGKNDLLDKYLGGSAYTAAWYCGLIALTSYSAIAAADTMASHAGWLEAGGTNAPAYTGNRPALTFGAAAAGVKSTSSASSFTFTSAGTIKGMFANSVTTKDGTTGVLYNGVLFTGGDRLVGIGDVVNVSVSYTAT